MAEGVFNRVLVPVEFEVAKDKEIAADRTVEVEPDKWVVVGRPTVQALKLAARMAAGGEVRLCHAAPDLRRAVLYGGPQSTWFRHGNLASLERDAADQSIKVLRRFGEQHCPGVTLAYDVGCGPVLDVILDAARAHPPDAIVMAASGRGVVQRAVLGSVADKVIRQATCPVIVVPVG
jgi:nucleotide-binding universal stress UspA family protein